MLHDDPLIKTITLADIWKNIPLDIPVFLDYHMYDIPETMKLAIYNAPHNVMAVSFSADQMPDRWKNMVEKWCGDCCIEVVWWSYKDVKG